MKAKNMFSEMVFYIEACESGSMFPKLAAYSNVYAMTASNEKVSSWAAYCNPHDSVKGKRVGACLGDLFSVNWMNDTESHITSTEKLDDQHLAVVSQTKKSPVCEFGDMRLKQKTVCTFEGDGESWYGSMNEQ